MPTFKVRVTLYVDADDKDDAVHIAREMMTLYIRKSDVHEVERIKEPRFERTMTAEECKALWQRSHMLNG